MNDLPSHESKNDAQQTDLDSELGLGNFLLHLLSRAGKITVQLEMEHSRTSGSMTTQNIIVSSGEGTTVALDQENSNSNAPFQVVDGRRTLDKILRGAGLEAKDLQKLTEAIHKDGGAGPNTKVGDWIKEHAGKVLCGGVKIGTEIGTKLLTAWLEQHCGIH